MLDLTQLAIYGPTIVRLVTGPVMVGLTAYFMDKFDPGCTFDCVARDINSLFFWFLAAITLVGVLGLPADLVYLGTFDRWLDQGNKWVQATTFEYPNALATVLTLSEMAILGVLLTSNYYGGELSSTLAYISAYFILFSLPLVPAWVQLGPAMAYARAAI